MSLSDILFYSSASLHARNSWGLSVRNLLSSRYYPLDRDGVHHRDSCLDVVDLDGLPIPHQFAAS